MIGEYLLWEPWGSLYRKRVFGGEKNMELVRWAQLIGEDHLDFCIELSEQKGLELQGLIYMKNALLKNKNDTSGVPMIGLDMAGRKKAKQNKPAVVADIHSVKSQKEKCVNMIK